MRSVRIVSVFVASPSDVASERKSLERVVREVNLIGRTSDSQLELKKWETHTHPGVGTDPQNVINTQLDDDYDVFLGIFWSRIGTPTPRANSGTVEEFERAYERSKRSPGTVEIMIYFKDEAVPPSQIDADQLAALQSFARTLTERGVLYSSFRSTSEFEELTRLHLAQVLSRFNSERDMRTAGREIDVVSRDVRPLSDELDDPDIGLLDLDEIFQASIQRMIAAQIEIQNATTQLTAKIDGHAKSLDALASARDKKVVLEETAAEFVHYATAIEKLLPDFREAQNRMSVAAIRRVTFENGATISNSDRQELVDTLDGLIATYRETHGNIKRMRDTAADLPRLTANLNRARRRVVAALNSLLDLFESGEKLLLTMRDATLGAPSQASLASSAAASR